MLKILKVKGDSLYPDYTNGDFVVIAKSPFCAGRIRVDDVVAFHQVHYGLMIKKVAAVLPEGLNVRGSLVESIDSRQFGLVPRQDVIGKVIWHIRQS